MEKRKYTVVDLFCGAGGLSKGFFDADFDVVLGVDFDEPSLQTFEANHGSAKAMKLDLFNHNNIDEIKKYLNDNNIKLDVLVGGPPCQGFSLAGKREENDERNILYSAMVKTAKILQPKIVVLENVPGMLKLYEGKGAIDLRRYKDYILQNIKSQFSGSEIGAILGSGDMLGMLAANPVGMLLGSVVLPSLVPRTLKNALEEFDTAIGRWQAG